MKTIKIILICFFLSLFCQNSIFAKKEASLKEKKDPTIELKYQKNSDLSRSLTCDLYISGTFENDGVKSASLDFYNGATKLGTLKTNKKGKAVLILAADYKLTGETDGTFKYSVSYAGNDTLNAVEAKTAVKEVSLDMQLDPKDTLKNITASVYLEEAGKKTLLKGIDVKFFVPRMFSLLPVGSGTTDSTGKVSIAFPPNIAGDSTGNVTIIAKIVKNDTYGNVEKSQVVKWGFATSAKLLPKHGELWTEIAPIWMIITLTILLLGVWLHYLFVIYRLTKLKKLNTN